MKAVTKPQTRVETKLNKSIGVPTDKTAKQFNKVTKGINVNVLQAETYHL